MILTLIAKLKSTENICYGPFCSTLNAQGSDATVSNLLSSTLGKVINLALMVGGLFLLFYMMWGALDWIMSEGDKEKLTKAQNKITNAIIGMILMVVALGIFGVVTGDILGIVTRSGDGSWAFKIPKLIP